MNALAGAALAAGELICEFSDGYRRSLVAALAGERPATELVLIYTLAGERGEVLSSRSAGKRAMHLQVDGEAVHLVQADGASRRVTSLTGCERGEEASCTRFSARHAWIVDAGALPALPVPGSAAGACEPWRMESQ